MHKYSKVVATILLCVALSCTFSDARPSRRHRDRNPSYQRGAPGFRAPSSITSTAYGRKLENKFRLGLDKKGLDSKWTVDNPYQHSRLRLEPEHVQYVPPSPQLSGSMGAGNMRPRRLGRDQYVPKAYASPNGRLASAPEALKSMTYSEKNAVAMEFFLKFGYAKDNALNDREDMIITFQRNYGLNQTGELDEHTITKMMAPRCGVKDGPSEYNLFPYREHWKHKDITYNIKGYTPDLSQCQVRNAFKRAFRVWEEVTDLRFEKVDRDDADMIIYFGYEEHGDGYPFDGPNGLLAHAFAPGDTNAISGDTHFDEEEFWTLGKGRVFDTYGGNSGGEPCAFPFMFQSKTYTACTSVGRSDGLEWCSTTADYDADGQWAYCPHELLFTYAGNGDNDPCVFPFIFLGKEYDACTYDGRSDGYMWCSTTSNFDTDGKYGFCPARAHDTEGGNANGAGCHFPFKFEGYTYTDCTTVGRNDYKLWCATTDDYDRDQMWGFCMGDGYSLFLVATHEFGHAIGLDHSNREEALMYPMYSYHADFVLPDDDKRGAQDLYGPRTKSLTPLVLEQCGGDLTSEPTATKTPISTTSTPTPRTTTPRRRTTTPTQSTTTRGTVDRCETSYPPSDMYERKIDSIMLYQNEYFVFQGAFVWRVTGRGKDQVQTLDTVRRHWPTLRCGVDAAYQNPNSGLLMFFVGSQYYMFDGATIQPGYPREITELGLPQGAVVDDVVFMNTRNPTTRKRGTRLYYFVGDKVYRADPGSGQVRRNAEPTTLGRTPAWRKLPTSVDAVFSEKTNRRYTMFVKGEQIYRYENFKGKRDYDRRLKKFFVNSKSEDNVALPLRERE